MDSMRGVEMPDYLPEIKYIDVSNEEYQKIMNVFNPDRNNLEDDIMYLKCGNCNEYYHIFKDTNHISRCNEK